MWTQTVVLSLQMSVCLRETVCYLHIYMSVGVWNLKAMTKLITYLHVQKPLIMGTHPYGHSSIYSRRLFDNKHTQEKLKYNGCVKLVLF